MTDHKWGLPPLFGIVALLVGSCLLYTAYTPRGHVHGQMERRSLFTVLLEQTVKQASNHSRLPAPNVSFAPTRPPSLPSHLTAVEKKQELKVQVSKAQAPVSLFCPSHGALADLLFAA